MVRPNPRFDPVTGIVTTPTKPKESRPNPRYGDNITYSLSLNQLNENINRIKEEIDLIYDPAWMMSPTDKNPIPVGWARLGDETTTMLNPAYPKFAWSDKLEFAGGHQGTDPRYRPSPIRNPEPNSEIERNFGIFTAKTAIQYLKDSVRYWQAVKDKYDFQCSQTIGSRECELGASLGAGLLNEMNGMIQKLEKEKREMNAGTHRNIPEQYKTAQAQQFEFFPEASAQEEPIIQQSQQVNQIINDINNNVIQIPDWFRNNIEWVQSGHINEQQFLTAYNYLVDQQITQPTVTQPTVTQPTINDSITDNMIIQKIDYFTIENGRAIGQITFTATENFNPFYYNKTITNLIQFKDHNGVNILPTVKQNNLRFTATERTEIIHYDEGMKDNIYSKVSSFVWSSATKPTPFTKQLEFEIREKEPVKPISSGFMAAGVAGAIAGLVLLGFIADHRGGK